MNLLTRKSNGRRTWDSFDLMRDFQDEIGRIFGELLVRRRGLPAETITGIFDPDLDIREEAERFIVEAEIPGVKKDDLNISVRGNLLTFSGEKKFEKESKEKNYHCAERTYGFFSRTVELPVEVKAEGVKATYKEGILEISLPKSEAASPKQIQVDVK